MDVNNSRVNQAQGMPTSVEVNPAIRNEGFLNGVKVSIKEVKTDDFHQVRVGKDQFEKIPVTTRLVKVLKSALKKVKSLKTSKPKKAVEHAVAGTAKRAVKKENWAKVSQAEANRELEKVSDIGERDKLATKIRAFNEKLEALGQMKDDINDITQQNIEFKDRYQTAIDMAKAKRGGKSIPSREGLIVALPPSEKGGEDQYIQLSSPSSEVRKADAAKLAKIFKNCDEYNAYLDNKALLPNLKKGREKLKKEIRALEKEMKALHKGDLKTKAIGEKAKIDKESDRQKGLTKAKMEHNEVVYTADMDSKISSKVSEASTLNSEIRELRGTITELELGVDRDLEGLQKYDSDLAYYDDGDVRLSEYGRVGLNPEGVEAMRQKREELHEYIAQNRGEISRLNEELTGKLAQLDAAKKEEKELHGQRTKELTRMGKERREALKQHDKIAKNSKKSLDEEPQADGADFDKLVGGQNAAKRAGKVPPVSESGEQADNLAVDPKEQKD